MALEELYFLLLINHPVRHQLTYSSSFPILLPISLPALLPFLTLSVSLHLYLSPCVSLSHHHPLSLRSKITNARGELAHHKLPFAHTPPADLKGESRDKRENSIMIAHSFFSSMAALNIIIVIPWYHV